MTQQEFERRETKRMAREMASILVNRAERVSQESHDALTVNDLLKGARHETPPRV